MHEHIARTLYYFNIHLLYASFVWFAAWALTSSLRASATAKYWIWVAAALNFILPLGVAPDALWSVHLRWASPLGAAGDVANTLSRNWLVLLLWALGAIVMLTRLALRLQTDRRHARSYQTNLDQVAWSADGVPVRFTPSQQAPAVNGVLHPHIALPNGIERLLTGPELNAVILHELTHVRRRDNLIRLIYEIGLCFVWFHPLVWIAGRRLAVYRELSCDESVIRQAHASELVSALAKLADPRHDFLLQATASSFISHRLGRLSASQAQPRHSSANWAMAAAFSGALLTGVFATVAHTACCFIAKH